jgi:hypothetical protein
LFNAQQLAQPYGGLLDVPLIEAGSTWIRRTNSPQMIEEVITVTEVTVARLDRSNVYVQYSIDGHTAGTFTGKVAAWRRSFRPSDGL